MNGPGEARGREGGPAGLDRREVARRTQRVLNRGRWGNPDVLLVDAPQGPVVLKDFAPRRSLVRRFWGPWLLTREELAYRRLAGMAAVPRLIGRLDAQALVLEYRPGILLSRSLRGVLPETFLVELEESIREMHRRGVVHLDLRHRSNVLACAEGHPVLLDFASALRLDPERWPARWLLRLLASVDRRALEKWRVRLQPPRETAPRLL
ncbi:MAG: protein kinase family protein [bacterium]